MYGKGSSISILLLFPFSNRVEAKNRSSKVFMNILTQFKLCAQRLYRRNLPQVTSSFSTIQSFPANYFHHPPFAASPETIALFSFVVSSVPRGHLAHEMVEGLSTFRQDESPATRQQSQVSLRKTCDNQGASESGESLTQRQPHPFNPFLNFIYISVFWGLALQYAIVSY
jgi:hypothetical protein